VRRFVDLAATARGVDEILREIAPALHVTLFPFVHFCLQHPRVGSVAAVAEAMGVHRKTLFVRCRDASAPPPGIIITWCRLLSAAHLLSTSMRSVETVSADLGFASPTTFRNITRRYTGLRPTELRDRNAMVVVIRAFLTALSRAAVAPVRDPDHENHG